MPCRYLCIFIYNQRTIIIIIIINSSSSIVIIITAEHIPYHPTSASAASILRVSYHAAEHAATEWNIYTKCKGLSAGGL